MTWNIRGLFAHVNYDPAKRAAKFRRAASILEKVDAFALQEAHPHDLEEFAKLHPRFLLHGTFCAANPQYGRLYHHGGQNPDPVLP